MKNYISYVLVVIAVNSIFVLITLTLGEMRARKQHEDFRKQLDKSYEKIKDAIKEERSK